MSLPEPRETDEPLSILFLCTGNSARSILAEFLLRDLEPARFATFSAGSHPKGTVHPLAVRVLRELYGIDSSPARSKSWEEFSGRHFDLVVTVCDDAKESCPIFPGQTVTAHWGMPDPAAVAGSEEECWEAFVDTARVLSRRLDLLRNLPFESLDRLAREERAREIGGR